MTITEEALQEVVSLRAEVAELKAQMARRNDRMVEALNLLHSAGFGLRPDGVTFTEMVSEAVHELERLRQPSQDWVAVAKELESLRTQLAEAQKSAAAWEIQAQDLRDKLLQATNLCANGCGHPEHGGFCR